MLRVAMNDVTSLIGLVKDFVMTVHLFRIARQEDMLVKNTQNFEAFAIHDLNESSKNQKTI